MSRTSRLIPAKPDIQIVFTFILYTMQNVGERCPSWMQNLDIQDAKWCELVPALIEVLACGLDDGLSFELQQCMCGGGGRLTFYLF